MRAKILCILILVIGLYLEVSCLPTGNPIDKTERKELIRQQRWPFLPKIVSIAVNGIKGIKGIAAAGTNLVNGIKTTAVLGSKHIVAAGTNLANGIKTAAVLGQKHIMAAGTNLANGIKTVAVSGAKHIMAAGKNLANGIKTAAVSGAKHITDAGRNVGQVIGKVKQVVMDTVPLCLDNKTECLANIVNLQTLVDKVRGEAKKENP